MWRDRELEQARGRKKRRERIPSRGRVVSTEPTSWAWILDTDGHW